MRKKTIENLSDNIMWYLIYLLPIIGFLFLILTSGGQSVVFADVFNSLGLQIVTDNVIVDTLTQIFGVGGVFPIFASQGMIYYFTYFIATIIIHLAVDFLLFIPRLAHKWLGKVTE